MNIDDFGSTLQRHLEERKRRLLQAMDSVMIEMVNYVKENGAWTDRTGNLRNSISYKPAEFQGDGTAKGVVYAGMEYAIYVEYKEGHWILSGAMEHFRPVFLRMIKERIGL